MAYILHLARTTMAQPVTQVISGLLDRYPAGYVEVLGSIGVQVAYFVFGLIIERFRPHYIDKSSSRMFTQCLKNHAIATSFHIAYVVYRRGGSVLTQTFMAPYELPSIMDFIVHMTVGLFLREVIFYTVHRLWHVPGVYELVHKQHHNVLDPSQYHVWTISYMSVTDFLFLYGAPVMVIAKILEMNIVTTLLFAFISAIIEQIHLVAGDKAHLKHHHNWRINYGVYGLMDRVFGTKF